MVHHGTTAHWCSVGQLSGAWWSCSALQQRHVWGTTSTCNLCLSEVSALVFLSVVMETMAVWTRVKTNKTNLWMQNKLTEQWYKGFFLFVREDPLLLHKNPAVQVKSSSSMAAVARCLCHLPLTQSSWRLKPHDLALSASFTIRTAVKSPPCISVFRNVFWFFIIIPIRTVWQEWNETE